MSVIHYSNFSPNPYGHGGEKRTSQIRELLLKNSQEIVEYYQLPVKSRPSIFKKFLAGLRYLKALKLWSWNLRNVLEVGNEICAIEARLTSSNFHDKVVICEISHNSNNRIPYVANALGIPVIGLPHNLESLVPDQQSAESGNYGINWLIEELQILKYCDSVFTISLEENWFLNVNGIKSHFLPYYPTKEVEQSLLKIRDRRKSRRIEGFLLFLGTVNNPPTRIGLLEIIEYLQSHLENAKIKIAGFGTESLRHDFDTSNSKFEILGSVSNSHLEMLLTNAKAVIINQEPTSGALTRIPEMILAGVPIISNIHASRTYYNLPGIICFQDFDDIISILKNLDGLIQDSSVSKIKTDFWETLINEIKDLRLRYKKLSNK